MVKRFHKKEPGVNTVIIVISFTVLFLAIVVLYYMMLWDNIVLSQEELHSGLQMAETYTITEKNLTSERNRTQIVWDKRQALSGTTYTENTPISDGTLDNFATNFTTQINKNFDLINHMPQSGALKNLSKSKGIYIEDLVVIERITGDSNQFLEYVVYDFEIDVDGNLIKPISAITGSSVNSYLQKITGGTPSYTDGNALKGSTMMATISFKESGATVDGKLKNPITRRAEAISDVEVTEVIDLTLAKDDTR